MIHRLLTVLHLTLTLTLTTSPNWESDEFAWHIRGLM